MRRLLPCVPILLLFPLAACEDEQPQEPGSPPAGYVFRTWQVHALANDERFDDLVGSGALGGGVVDEVEEIGPMSVFPQGTGPTATAQVFSNVAGTTYWVSAQAPTSADGLAGPDSLIGSESELTQVWRYRKLGPGATLRFVITRAFLEAMDHNGLAQDFEECPWWVGGPVAEFPNECAELVKGEVEATFYAYTDPTRADGFDFFYVANGVAKLFGFLDRWTADSYTGAESDAPVFGDAAFDTDTDVDGDGRHAWTRLSEPIAIDVPLDSIDPGNEFEVVARLRARAYSRRQGESYVSAFLRDPAAGDGLTVESDGLLLLEPPEQIPQLVRGPGPASPCTAPGAGPTGTIQFDSTAYLVSEWPGNRAWIIVRRTGGSDGEVSAAFATSDGSAAAGADYTSVTTRVRFADGEEGARVVQVPILADTVAEPNETVALSLSSPGGCATLGLSSAELTIYDDDRPPPEDSLYSVGGTVSGLEGTGLRLRNISALVDITADGPFAFPGEYPSGRTYDVTVDQQPSNPLQSCTITNGQGTVADGDVTDILVTCETPAATDVLDPGFGTNGIAEVDIVPYRDDRFAARLALQDGNILVIGTNTLARLDAGGNLDAGFGTSGEVRVEFAGQSDVLHDVAVQPDGRILVAGIKVDPVNLPADDDFGLARYEADGTLDTSYGVLDPTFGTDGVEWTATPETDLAFGVAVDGSDRIVVAGQSGVTAFVARYGADGGLDAGFGNGGIVVDSAMFRATDVAVDDLDRVIIVGAQDGDFCVIRLLADGSRDPAFGEDGLVTIDFFADFDQASDVLIQPDGKIVVAGKIENGNVRTVGVVRLLP